MKGVYHATRKLCSESRKKIDMVKNSSDKLSTKKRKCDRGGKNASWKYRTGLNQNKWSM